MFTAARFGARRAAAAAWRSAAPRRLLNTAAAPALLRSGTTAAVGAAVLLAGGAAWLHSQQSACEPGTVTGTGASGVAPSAAAAGAGAAPAVSAADDPPLAYFVPTRSRKDQLPEDVTKVSMEELAQIYDPALKDQEASSLAHAVVWGTPPFEHALPHLPLLFTATNPDPFKRHMELLVRSIQDRICNDLIDVEQRAADKAPGQPGGPGTMDELDGHRLGSEGRAMLLSQGDAPGRMREVLVVRPGGTGGGIERVLAGGRVFSKAGVNTSVSNVSIPANRFHPLAADHPSLAKYSNWKPTQPIPLFTASISLVLHPVSPHVPTVHANYRYFELQLPAVPGVNVPADAPTVGADGAPLTVKHWWFGGGSDLTPTYVVDEDARFFHATLRRTLDRVAREDDSIAAAAVASIASSDVSAVAPSAPAPAAGASESYYPRWKKACDVYFRLPHRAESRGVGGVFYDDEHAHPGGRAHYERVMRALGESFSASYFPIVLKHMNTPFSAQELAFQQLRRGRYVEFNLVYDRGTTYGMRQAVARPEAILMSLPPIARFAYRQVWDQRAQYTKEVLTNPKEW